MGEAWADGSDTLGLWGEFRGQKGVGRRGVHPCPLCHRLVCHAGLIFLAASLWLGPWNVLRRRPNPVCFDLRRDIGIWTGIVAIVHTAIGLTVHLRGRMWMYFFKGLHPLKLQNTQFGFANFTGLGAALLFLMLLAISNDLSLRTFKARRWKSMQRWTYVAFLLTGHMALGIN